ncbi:hypothetical protein DXG01_006989, partial [Tephrocybe rancida]
MAPKGPSLLCSSPSIRSVASSTACSAKKTLNTIKSTVKKAFLPKKKARTTHSGSDSEGDVSSQPMPSVIDVDTISNPPISVADNNDGKESDGAKLKRLKATWGLAVYSFFKNKVDIIYKGKGKVHVFYCAAKQCKGKGSVCRYQDSKDKAATSNLKAHTVKCFGENIVSAAFNKKGLSLAPWNGSIFAVFSCPGQKPVTVTHRTHSLDETHAHMALWCAESNCALNIVHDQQFETLMKAGRPGTTLLSPTTVSHDIKAVFERCYEHLDNILRKHDGLVHFATDAWTSPNHHAMVAWTVHLHHEGNILVFLLNVIEVPETSEQESEPDTNLNDIQDDDDGISSSSSEGDNNSESDNNNINSNCSNPSDSSDKDDNSDPFEGLSQEDQDTLLADTEAVQMTLNKIRKLSFAIVHSTTISLPAWHDTCVEHGLHVHLTPHNVKTHWNSTYNMLTMALEYPVVVDNITSDKKLWCYELDEEDWQIISDLNHVLKVYKDATLFFSANNVTSITNVILTMDHIDKMLNDDVSNTALTPSVHAALSVL